MQAILSSAVPAARAHQPVHSDCTEFMISHATTLRKINPPSPLAGGDDVLAWIDVIHAPDLKSVELEFLDSKAPWKKNELPRKALYWLHSANIDREIDVRPWMIWPESCGSGTERTQN